MVMNLRIRELRKEAHLTQREVARYLHCDQSLCARYELGDRQLPLSSAVRLARLYEVSLDYLLGLTDDPN